MWLILARWIQRNNEGSFWPYVTSRIEGRLNQGGSLLGRLSTSATTTTRTISGLMPTLDGSELVRTGRVGPDSWQFFVKASYLVRF